MFNKETVVKGNISAPYSTFCVKCTLRWFLGTQLRILSIPTLVSTENYVSEIVMCDIHDMNIYRDINDGNMI